MLSITGLTVPAAEASLEGFSDLVSPSLSTPLTTFGLGVSPTDAAAAVGSRGGSNGARGGGGAPPEERPLLFASASADGTVRLWSASCWSCMRVFRSAAAGALQPPVLSCAMNESWVAAGMPDGIVRLLSIDDAYTKAVQVAFGLADCGADAQSRPGSAVVERAEAGPAAKKARLESGGARQGAGGGAAGALARAGSAVPPLPASRLEREFEKALRSFIRIK